MRIRGHIVRAIVVNHLVDMAVFGVQKGPRDDRIVLTIVDAGSETDMLFLQECAPIKAGPEVMFH